MSAHAFGGWSIEKPCYDRIRELVPDGGTILELGSGDVTDELAKHYEVYSIEENPDRMRGPHCGHAPIVNGWYDPVKVKEIIPAHYDLILVDGPRSANGASRMGMVSHMDLFDPTVPMVFDDVNRPDDDEVMRIIALMTCRLPEVTKGVQKDFGVLL